MHGVQAEALVAGRGRGGSRHRRASRRQARRDRHLDGRDAKPSRCAQCTSRQPPSTDIVLISPNLQPSDRRSNWLTRPLGPLLAQLISGDDAQLDGAQRAAGALLVDELPDDGQWSRSCDWSTTCGKQLADVRTSRPARDRVARRQRRVGRGNERRHSNGHRRAAAATHRVRTGGRTRSRHVLAGDILSPENTTDTIATTIVDFVTAP